VLTAWRPAITTEGLQSTSVDGRQALQAAVALVQQGRLD
jgi:hypothetical protein